MSGDNYQTDQWILDLFPNFYDPCPLFGYNSSHLVGYDGLTTTWDYADYDGVFVNPPYSNPKPWVEKAIQEHSAISTYSAGMIVLLLKHDSSTEWYRLLHEAGAKFLLINGRLKHQTGSSAAFPSLLAVLK